MIPTLNLEPTKENIEYASEFADLCSDYELGFLTDDEFEKELQKLNNKYRGE